MSVPFEDLVAELLARIVDESFSRLCPLCEDYLELSEGRFLHGRSTPSALGECLFERVLARPEIADR